ncbi:MAG TPA: type II toxin-antitoxin system PemK/MazF family toxin [Anaerolineae bacterium]|nr:type II toxin-antitoxin system PemK/MazF family toxin [Anaerolineae bacterium]
MAFAGQIVLFRFPQTDLKRGKLRPALIIGKLPGSFDDWLICMITSQTHHHIAGFDNIITIDDADFPQSGLKNTSIIRIGRLAVVDASMLLGAIGEVNPNRLAKIKTNLAQWLSQ